MKKFRWILICIIVLVVSFVVGILIHNLNMKNKEDRQLEIASEIINDGTNEELEILTKEELQLNENVIGILEIPSIDLIAPIQEGTSMNVLNQAVGHFSESSFWNGNVAFASHNRSMYAHYFERINELQQGDEIIYKTKLGTKTYIVYENNVIPETNWTVIENTKDNIITLITCVKNKPEIRLCVRGIEL